MTAFSTTCPRAWHGGPTRAFHGTVNARFRHPSRAEQMSIALARATARHLKSGWRFDGSVADLMVKLSEMTELQRIVVGLRYYDELDSRQIAEVLEIDEDRVIRIFVDALEPLLVSSPSSDPVQ